jgi:hypothetical protein
MRRTQRTPGNPLTPSAHPTPLSPLTATTRWPASPAWARWTASSTGPVQLEAAPSDLARRRLLWALPSGLATVSPLGLLACGGSGGGGDSTPPGPTAQATLRLPASINASTVTIVSNGGELRPDGTSVAVAMADDKLALASVVHSSEKLVLLGLLQAGGSNQNLDARSSAAALMFMAMGGWALTGADRARLHQLIQNHAQLNTLTAVVEARMAADPYALDGPDAAITTAVLAAMRSVRGAAPGAATKATATPVRALAPAPTEPVPLLRIEPGGEVNGISVDQAGDTPGFTIQNTKRRRGIGHAYKVAYKPTDLPRVDLALAQVQYERIEVASTQSLSVFSALSDIISGTAPWSPVTTPRYGLPMQDGVEQTIYEMIYITPVYDKAEPAFFGEVRYSLLRAGWREELALMFEAAQMELVFGAVLEALGFGGIAQSTATYNAAIAAIRSAVSSDAIVLLNRARNGSALLPAFRAWLISVTRGGVAIVSDPGYRAGVAALTQQANAQFAADLAAGNMARLRLIAFNGTVRVMLAVSVVAGVLDTAAQYRDLHEGEAASLFTATLVAPKVLISPSTGRVGKGTEQRLTARVTGTPTGANLRYKWGLTGSSLANLRDGRGAVGASFETASETVILATTPSTVGTLVITVEALLVVAGAAPRSLGTATSRLEMDDTVVQLLPAEARVERVAGSQLFTLSITPAAGTGILYEWVCLSANGSLRSGSQSTSAGLTTIITDQPTATYTVRSGLAGGESETLRCTAFRTAPDPTTGETVRTNIGSASAEVLVKQKFNLELHGVLVETPTNNTLGITGHIVENLPTGATVVWTWSNSGVGSLQAPSNDANRANSVATFTSGASEGTAVFTVQARVVTADGQATPILPVTRSTQVKQGLREITFEATGGSFACSDPLACGVSEYSAYIVPRYSRAVSYRAVFSDFAFAGCNRSVTWNGVVGDGGGCRFPITYHPHSSAGATNAWAVWIGFGGWGTGPGKCVVTVTLAP